MVIKKETETRVRCVAISSNGECLVVGGFDKHVHMSLLTRGTQLYHFSYDGKSLVKSISLSSDSLLLGMGCDCSGKGAVLVFHASESRLLFVKQREKAIWAVRFGACRRALPPSLRSSA
jgi:hypothetical protein